MLADRVSAAEISIERAAQWPKLLLVVGGSPSGKDGGEIILADLASAVPRDRWVRFHLPTDPDEAIHDPGLPHPREQAVSVRGFRWALTSIPIHQRIRRRHAPRIAAAVAEAARAEGSEVVWVVLNGPTLIYVARELIERFEMPVRVTVWDPPEYFKASLGLAERVDRTLLEDFHAVLQRAEAVSVISESMREEYARAYGVESIIVRHGLDRSQWAPIATAPRVADSLTIGFAGSLYAIDAFRAFVRMLECSAWRLDGRDIRLRIVGPAELPGWLTGDRIESIDWRPVDETVRLLAETDVLYLPYWFDPARADFTRLSFPTKLASYLAAGRPVFFHGPVDSSVCRFMLQHPVGATCASPEARAIESAFAALIDPVQYAEASGAIARARDAELNRAVFVRRFQQFLAK